MTPRYASAKRLAVLCALLAIATTPAHSQSPAQSEPPPPVLPSPAGQPAAAPASPPTVLSAPSTTAGPAGGTPAPGQTVTSPTTSAGAPTSGRQIRLPPIDVVGREKRVLRSNDRPTQQAGSPAQQQPVTSAPKAAQKAAAAPKTAAAPSRPPQQPALSQSAPTQPPTNGASGTPAPAPAFPAQAAGQTVTTVGDDRTTNTRAFNVGDILQESPGISVKQGNGPRDLGVSIRGSNARNGFGIRNIQVFEDGFPVTQPDGLSRGDLIDPHAYRGIDVWRGPSSALFGNYATGGAVNFRQRTGADINGFEYGTDFGSFGYLNNYMALGKKFGAFEYSLFASDVRGEGHLDWSAFNTQTVEFLGTFSPSVDDKLTVKFIKNELGTDLSIRLSLNQFFLNPFQAGCVTGISAGCGSVSLFRNGFNGAKVSETAAQAGLGRNDQRTILGTRWEHKLGENTTWQMQYVVDDRNIHQPTGTTSAVGDFLSQNVMTHLEHKYLLLGMKATSLIGYYYNYLPNNNDTINLMPGGNATLGQKTQNVTGYTGNMGVRVREEVKPTEQWTFAAGASFEMTQLHGLSTAYGYTGSVNGIPTSITSVFADQQYDNRAWEISLAFKPTAAWNFRGRVATGYGTPQIGNLFVTQAGTPGNNTQLASQRNLGYDLGLDFTPSKWLKVSLTGFYELFYDEIISLTPGAGLQSYAFNIPDAEHRGVEVALELQPARGWKVTTAYTYNDQIVTSFNEQLKVTSGGKTLTANLDRSGNKIPGVAPNELLARIGYDEPSGQLKGLGAYVEWQWKDAFFMDSGNVLKAPGYDLVNLNMHWDAKVQRPWLDSARAYFEIRNLFDRTHIASANNITDSLATSGTQNGAGVLANSTGSIYAGTPRTYYGGFRLKF
jgi:iron complex outermembrane recepter protein